MPELPDSLQPASVAKLSNNIECRWMLSDVPRLSDLKEVKK
jgi:hypothetical protein